MNKTKIFFGAVILTALVSCGTSTTSDVESIITDTTSNTTTNTDDSFTSSTESTLTESLPPDVEYQRSTYQNPLKFYKQDGTHYYLPAADPDIIYGGDGYFYLYITNAQVEMGSKGLLFDRGPIFRSKDMISWTWCGSVFDGHPNEGTWGHEEAGVRGPTVIKVGNNYNYYYSLSAWGDPNPGIGVASSPTPYGPWTHYGRLLDQEMTGVRNGIDPYVCYLEDELYVIWGSFFGIAATKLTDDGTELFYGDSVKDNLHWLVENNRVGQNMDVNVNYEGSYIVKKDGSYYFFGSMGTCLAGTNSTYTVKVGKADNLFGPYYGSDGKTMTDGTYGDVVVQPSDAIAGTGHNAVIQDFAGDYWLIYHGFDNNSKEFLERQLFIDKLIWDEETSLPYIKNRQASCHTDRVGPLTIK